MSKILKLAFAELGEKEIPGSEHNDRIVAYAEEAGIATLLKPRGQSLSLLHHAGNHQLHQ